MDRFSFCVGSSLLFVGVILLLSFPTAVTAEECYCGDGNTPTLGCCGGDGQRPCVLSSFSPFSDCSSTCNPDHVQTVTSFCAKPRIAGQSCGPAFPCEEDHTCWPGDFKCYANVGTNPIPASACTRFHSPVLHQAAINGTLPVNNIAGNTTFLGPGEAVAYGLGGYTDLLGESNSKEIGVLYGADGSFGCYVTTCTGFVPELASTGAFAAQTVYGAYGLAEGSSQVFLLGAEIPGVELGAGAVLAEGKTCSSDIDLGALSDEEFIATIGVVGTSLGIVPINTGCWSCNTTVSTAITPAVPVADCVDFDAVKPVCAEPTTCVADISIDEGSYAPPGRTLVSRVQSPAGPYRVPDNFIDAFIPGVTLNVTDSAGAMASCTSAVLPVDCQPPEIACPEPVTAECQGLVGEEFGDPFLGAVVSAPAAHSTSDNCSASLNEILSFGESPSDNELSFPLGKTPLPYFAFDGYTASVCALPEGQESVCDDGEDNDSDGLIDFPADPDCSSAGDPTEAPETGENALGGFWLAGDSSVTVVDTLSPTLTCPADVTVACEGPGGTTATFGVASAEDVCEGSLTSACNHESGEPFDLGATTVSCNATDSSMNEGSCTFKVNVIDETPPAIDCPADIVAECTSSAGAAVGFQATANDACSGGVTPTCDRSGGSIFALGAETVSCSAEDTLGNISACSFAVQVRDTTAPSLQIQGNVAPIECGIGSFVDPGASVQDACDANIAGITVLGSGSVDTSAIGTYPVHYNVSDASGNAAAQVQRNVSVIDTTPPAISCPDDLIVEPTSPQGATVSFAAESFADACDKNLPTPTCELSGTTFAVGSDTEASCSVADATSGALALSSSCSLNVKVLSETEMVSRLQEQVASLVSTGALNRGLERAFGRHTENILRSISRNRISAACDQLAGFVSQLEGQTNRRLTAEQVAPLIGTAVNLGATLSCNGG